MDLESFLFAGEHIRKNLDVPLVFGEGKLAEKEYSGLQLLLEYPESSDLACVWCTEPFDTLPILVPYRYDRRRRKLLVLPNVCCSLSCCKSYLLHTQRQNAAELCGVLSQIARSCFGWQGHIPPAPPVQALRKFGGYMSLEEFRKKSATHVCMLKLPPMMMTQVVVEEKRVMEESSEDIGTRQSQFLSKLQVSLCAHLAFKLTSLLQSYKQRLKDRKEQDKTAPLRKNTLAYALQAKHGEPH